MSGIVDYIEDVLTRDIQSAGNGDVVVRQGDQIVYLDREDSQVYLVTVELAQLVPAAPDTGHGAAVTTKESPS